MKLPTQEKPTRLVQRGKSLQNWHVILNFHLEFENQNNFFNHLIPVQSKFQNNLHVSFNG